MSAVRTQTPEMIGIREFARRDGCDESRVRKAIRDGHLPKLASKKLDARLVGTGWRLSNRRGADTRAERVANSADSPQKLRNLNPTMSAPSEPRFINADDMADLASAAAYDVAKLMLVMVPRPVLDPVLKALTRELSLVAADLLQERGVPPPAGLSTWRDYPSFARPAYYMDESAWEDASEEVGEFVGTPPPPLAISEARKEHYLAGLRQLEFEEKAGSLIAVGEAERAYGLVVDAVRTGYLALPTKIAPQLVGRSLPEISSMLTETVHAILNDLAEMELVDGEIRPTWRRAANGHG